MNAEKFTDTLRQLGYPNASSLDPTSLEWMFENEKLLPFFEWFSSNIDSNNVASESELKQYNDLVASGETIFEGSQLDELLQNVALTKEEDMSDEKIREDMDRLSHDIALAGNKCRKQTLIKQRDKLSSHLSALNHRVDKLGSVEDAANTQYRKWLEQSTADNNTMNTCLSQLNNAVQHLTSLYSLAHPSEGQSTTNLTSPFLSRHDLSQYKVTEEKFTNQVTDYTKKQFFEGIATITGSQEGSRYEILEVNHPETLLIKGESKEVNDQNCREFQRLKSVYPKSECDRITASAREKSTEATCNEAQRLITAIDEGKLASSESDLSALFKQSQSDLEALNRELANISMNTIPSLVEESAPAVFTPILTGDYDLKIARQDYFTANQEQVVNQLIIQKSRHEFLTMAYEVEARNHKDVHRFLTMISTQLSAQISAWLDRQKLMADPSLNKQKYQRSTIDSRDKSTIRQYNILDSKTAEDSQLYYTYSSLVQAAESLHQHLTSTQDALASNSAKLHDSLVRLEQKPKSLESILYSGSSASTGRPQLSPKEIHDTFGQLSDLVKRLEHAITDIVKDVKTKKKLLKSDPLLRISRDMFVHFFNDQPKLRQTIEELKSRLESQLVT